MPRNRLAKIWGWIKKNLALISVIIISLGVRFYGIYFDYPHVNFVSDEIHSISFVLKVLESRNLKVDVSTYPALLAFLYLPALFFKLIYTAVKENIFSVSGLKLHYIKEGLGSLYIVGRWYSVLFGSATVFLIYKINEVIFKKSGPALYGALVWAVGLIPVFLSHWGKAHSGMFFFLAASLFFILKFEEEKKIKFFSLSVLAAAFSFSVHYVGISAAAFPLMGWYFNRPIFKTKGISKYILGYISIILFFYLVNFNGVKVMVQGVLSDYYGINSYASLYPVGKLERFYYIFRDAFLVEPVFIVLSLGILILNFKSISGNLYQRYILGGIFINYLMMVSMVTAPMVSRHLVIFLFLIVPFGSAFLMDRFLESRRRKKVILILGIILIIPTLAITAKWLMLLRANTRLEAVHWLQNNLKKNEVVYSFDNYIDPPLSYRAAVWNKDNNGIDSSAKLDYIVSHKDEFKDGGVNIFYDLYNERYKELGLEPADYVIFSYWKKSDEGEIESNIRRYHTIELVQEFYPVLNDKMARKGIPDYINNPIDWRKLFFISKSGPFISVYKVEK